MRRLFLILLAFMAFLPSPASPALAVHPHALAHSACPMHGSHDGHCADHGCLGCSIEAAPTASIAPGTRHPVLIAEPGTITMPTPRRPGFDPPPPRVDG